MIFSNSGGRATTTRKPVCDARADKEPSCAALIRSLLCCGCRFKDGLSHLLCRRDRVEQCARPGRERNISAPQLHHPSACFPETAAGVSKDKKCRRVQCAERYREGRETGVEAARCTKQTLTCDS